MHGKLYRIPSAEREHALFDVEPAADAEPPLHPRGGHNYYNGRNMENAFRRLQFLGKIIEKRSDGWESRYLKRVHKYEGIVLDKFRSASEPSQLPMGRRSEGDAPSGRDRGLTGSSSESSGSESRLSVEPKNGRGHRSTASLPCTHPFFIGAALDTSTDVRAAAECPQSNIKRTRMSPNLALSKLPIP
jgi:hypothetical protein